MTKDEALKMAIEALAKCKEAYLAGPNWQKVGYDILDKSQQACKEALEQPKLTYEDGFAHGYEAHRAEQALEQPAQEPVSENDITKALDFLDALPNGYLFQPIDQERFERYVRIISKQLEWLQGMCATYAERAVKDGEQKIKDAQAIKKLFAHPAPSWQGLSDDEIDKIYFKTFDTWSSEVDIGFARAIEAKLKEKNNV